MVRPAPLAPADLPDRLGGRQAPEFFEHDPVSVAILALMRVNSRLLRSQIAEGPAFDQGSIAGLDAIEAASDRIRAEWDDLRVQMGPMPTVDDLIGREPGWDGAWESYAIRGTTGWFAHATARVPQTVALLGGVGGLVQASFSVLRPGTYLRPHRGPNTGVVRALLGIDVPEPDACGMLVGTERMDLAEGRLVVFDDTFEHAAWNYGTVDRVALLLEIRHPARGVANGFNGLCQRAFRRYPMVVRGNRRFEALIDAAEVAHAPRRTVTSGR